MVFFNEEIRAFNFAYFEKTCAALDTETEYSFTLVLRDIMASGAFACGMDDLV